MGKRRNNTLNFNDILIIVCLLLQLKYQAEPNEMCDGAFLNIHFNTFNYNLKVSWHFFFKYFLFRSLATNSLRTF